MEELMTCPKCGSNIVFIESTIAGFTLLYYARCYECNHYSGFKRNVHDAIEAWNMRADEIDKQLDELQKEAEKSSVVYYPQDGRADDGKV